MASISLPTIALIATAGSAAVSAYSSHRQGVAMANEDKQKARIAQEQATQQQISMRQKMLASLATQNAMAGVGGTSVNKANTMREITQTQNDLLANRAGASAQVSLLDSAASDATATGNLGAATDALTGAASAAKMWPGSPGASNFNTSGKPGTID